MSKKIEFPVIKTTDDTLTITITKAILIKAIEGRPDANYKVVKPDLLLERFARHLANYAESNAEEAGLSELQYLFDRVTDALYESAEDVLIDEFENL